MRIALFITPLEAKYAFKLRNNFSTNTVKVVTDKIENLTQLKVYCKNKGIDAVITTQPSLVQKLSFDPSAKISDFEGSMFTIPRTIKSSNLSELELADTMEILAIRSLDMLFKVPYQQFLTARIITKLTKPEQWITAPKYTWKQVDTRNLSEMLADFDESLFVAVDCETLRTLAIRCVGYTTCKVIDDEVVLNTYVLPVTSLENVQMMRKLNAHPVRKTLQNGKYDSAYFYIYSAPLTNYIFDTINMHHCWYAELPKDLASVSAFYVRKFQYWKDNWDTTDLHELYEYCGKDTYITALATLGWLKEAPQWAKNNYLQEFPVVAPSHLAEMTGIKADPAKFEELYNTIEKEKDAINDRLSNLLNVTNFNTNSPPQMKAMLKMLGCKDVTTTKDKALTKYSQKHPLNALLIDMVKSIRGKRKLLSSYLKEGVILEDARILKVPRILYAINPHGTDTGRNASNEHHFWIGLNIQNIPRGTSIKLFFIADEDFELNEADYAQAESRGTGYITGDMNLINKVESKLDFHKSNASDFFGIPYNEVTKALRQLAKPVNHGANYNMGAYMLIEQMGGEVEVLKAGRLLGLSPAWGAKAVATYLLNQFDKTYPKIRGAYHDWVKECIVKTHMLVGSTGWTRYCFGDPTKNKLDLNSYVAHNPQSLNAMILNKAFVKVFYTVWWNNPQDLLIHAQIHDSILFSNRKSKPELIDQVKKCMIMDTKVTDIDGVTRSMIVPVDVASGLRRWGDKAD